MTHRKSMGGQLVKRPPDLSGVRSQNDGWQEDLDEAFTVIKQVQAREAALASTTANDTRRFPVLDQKGARNV